MVALNFEGGIGVGKGRIRSWVEEETKEFGAWGNGEGVVELGT